MPTKNMKHSMTALAISTLLSACGGASNVSNSGANGTTTGAGTGNAVLSVDLVDAPVDLASNVYVNIVGMELQGPEERISYVYCLDDATETVQSAADSATSQQDQSELVNSDSIPDETPTDALDETNESMKEQSAEQPTCLEPETRSIDLLALTNGAAERLLDGVVIPAGSYQWIRLQLAENPGTLVLDDGTEHELIIPSGNQTGLKLTGGFDAYDDAPNHLVMDFDLRKSVINAGNKYLLKPTIKLSRIENATEQTLTGNWLHTEAVDCPAPMAYIFEGADATPNDIAGADTDPTASVEMIAAEDGLGWAWAAPFLEPGVYTVAYTCNGNTDDPEVDDQLDFRVQKNQTISSI